MYDNEMPQHYVQQPSYAQPQQIPEQMIEDPEQYMLQGSPPLDDTFTRWQHDTDDILQNLEFELKGFDKQHNTWKTLEGAKYAERFPNSLMNNHGVKDFMRLCRMNFNKIINTTNLNDKEIHQMAKDFELTVIEMLEHHYKRYGIRKPQDLPVIFGLICNPYFAILKQSFQDGTRRYLRGVMKYGESFQNIDRDAAGMGGKVSFMPKLFGGK